MCGARARRIQIVAYYAPQSQTGGPADDDEDRLPTDRQTDESRGPACCVAAADAAAMETGRRWPAVARHLYA